MADQEWMAGPMARNVSDLIFAAEGMYSIAHAQRDEGYMMRQRILPIPWQEEVKLPKKLKIGYFIEEGSVKVFPSFEAWV
jgi:Asp-tRNA(Asn)/Glu-tRNA(Gln) amidotransferase A subunit family amidase